MIPRLSWWDVPKIEAFGPHYSDRLFFNRTKEELWPAEISNTIYADIERCDLIDNPDNLDCAVRARDAVGQWTAMHQNQGTKPNITMFQDYEVARFLTCEGGPPDVSSWTVTSTIGSVFAQDLNHYWDWLVENSTLPIKIERPLLRPAFLDDFKVKKPHVQVQCHTYFDPDFEHGAFEFPHDELLTPPLDIFKTDVWNLPNEFVTNLLGDDHSIGNHDDTTHPYLLFDWFDTASNFSNKGAPSLGAVIIYAGRNNGTALHDALAACSFDGRWAPVEYSLDPRDTITIRQDSPSPMDMLNGSNKADPMDLTQMKISLEWADTINVPIHTTVPTMTTVEHLLLGWGSKYYIMRESEPLLSLGYKTKSLDWRISTTLGLYVTEALARAFQDKTKGSMLYRQAPIDQDSYIRYMDSVNNLSYKEGWRDGKLDWVEMRDPRWNWPNLSISHDTWGKPSVPSNFVLTSRILRLLWHVSAASALYPYVVLLAFVREQKC